MSLVQDVINRMEAAFSVVDAPPEQHRLSPPCFSFCEWEIEGHLWGQAYDVMWCFLVVQPLKKSNFMVAELLRCSNLFLKKLDI